MKSLTRAGGRGAVMGRYLPHTGVWFCSTVLGTCGSWIYTRSTAMSLSPDDLICCCCCCRYACGLKLDDKHSLALVKEAVLRNKHVGNYRCAENICTCIFCLIGTPDAGKLQCWTRRNPQNRPGAQSRLYFVIFDGQQWFRMLRQQ
jgi:hypothetical protein